MSGSLTMTGIAGTPTGTMTGTGTAAAIGTPRAPGTLGTTGTGSATGTMETAGAASDRAAAWCMVLQAYLACIPGVKAVHAPYDFACQVLKRG